jgi:two-component system NtrC family sensor kinase
LEDERKNLLEQLVRSEKLAAVGELISGVAHEINNPLTGILGLSELLLRENKENLNEDTKKDLKSIYESSERIKKIVANLLRFARFEAPVRKDASINELLDTVLNIRAYEMKVKNVELKKNYQLDLPLVMADHSQLEQVFLNLITNAEYAIHAKGKAGTLTITTSLQEKQPEDQKVIIEISDTGTGIPENVITKIFNPFFTTKPAGKGTGLGLSVSYGIIKEHGGEIHVRNQAEGGAVFTIELPVRGGVISEE